MRDFARGMRLSLPIVMGYLPVGFAFGVLAVQAGMTPLSVGLMSFMVFAGSGQLIAAQLLAAGTGATGIIITTFIVNLRHLLMSAALTPYLRSWSRPLQAWFSFEMTDETFAANLGRFTAHGVNKNEALGLNLLAHLGWITGGVAGALFDAALGDVRPLGLDYALPAMFIALVIPHLKVPRKLLAILSASFFSLALALLGAGQWNVMLATLLAATLAAFLPLGGRGDSRDDQGDGSVGSRDALSGENAKSRDGMTHGSRTPGSRVSLSAHSKEGRHG